MQQGHRRALSYDEWGWRGGCNRPGDRGGLLGNDRNGPRCRGRCPGHEFYARGQVRRRAPPASPHRDDAPRPRAGTSRRRVRAEGEGMARIDSLREGGRGSLQRGQHHPRFHRHSRYPKYGRQRPAYGDSSDERSAWPRTAWRRRRNTKDETEQHPKADLGGSGSPSPSPTRVRSDVDLHELADMSGVRSAYAYPSGGGARHRTRPRRSPSSGRSGQIA